MMTQPKVIFLDAVGTLFGVRGTVGEVYQAIAANFAIDVAADLLETAFRESFQASPPPVFPGATPEQIPQLEFNWWKAIAQATFKQTGVLKQFTDFDAFFTALYQHFTTAQPWYLYPDVIPQLLSWQQQEIALGIISNFDTRLYQVLEVLGLKNFFQTITISSITGSAKPESRIFLEALGKHNCHPEQAWHIGDSFQEDYQGAKSVGMKSYLLKRDQAWPEKDYFQSLTQIE